LRSPEEERELKEFFKSVRGVLIKRGLLKEGDMLSQKQEIPTKKERSNSHKKFKERREFPRINLTRDFSRTVILRINQPDKSENIKSFAENISNGGLCFDSQREFEKDNKLNLRLFFYGDQIPMLKIQTYIVWKKKIETTNYYGIYFDLIDEKDKALLNNYIRVKDIKRHTQRETSCKTRCI